MDDASKHKSILDGLIGHIPHAIFWKDKKLVFIGCNKQFALQFGYKDPKEIIGKTDYDFPFPPHLIEKYHNDDKEILITGIGKLDYEEVQAQFDGTAKTLLISKTPLYGKNKNIIGLLGIYTDITERKQQESDLIEAKDRAEIANKSKTEFLENMRHDIRTPLSGITGFARIIKEEADNPKIKEYADNLVASSDSLLNFMNEILETIHVASGEIPLLRNKFDLQKRLNDVIQLNQAKAKHKRLELTLNYDVSIPHYLIGDPKRIHRLVLELVTNALNFTEKGSVTVSASLAKKEGRHTVIKIAVVDTGVGVPPAKQQEIFLRFKRLHPSYEGIYKGIGLGLAVIKQFIDDLGGEIYVDSEVEMGSTFTCLVPLQEALIDEDFGVETIEETPIVYSTKPDPIVPTLASTTKGSTRILLVEDQLIASKMATHILSDLDCQIDHAPDGQTALAFFLQRHYDLIFMDVGLPDMSGLEVTQRIRTQAWNKGKSIPIVALTAHVEGDDKQRCIEAGMNAALSKPLTRETASSMLNALIPRRGKKMADRATNITKAAESDRLVNSGDVIDLDLAMKLTGGTKDFVQEMIVMLVGSFEEELKNLEQAHRENNWSKIRAIAHKIKGGAAYCGVARLKDASSRLEDYLRSDTRERAEVFYTQMLSEMELLKQYALKNSEFALTAE